MPVLNFPLPPSLDINTVDVKGKQKAHPTHPSSPSQARSSSSLRRTYSLNESSNPSVPVPGPSNVSWKSSARTRSRSFGPQIMGRSASSPPLSPAGSAPPKAKFYKHSSSKSLHTLQFDSHIDEGFPHSAVTPLSPIVEQDYFSPERRTVPLPIDSVEAAHESSSAKSLSLLESDVADSARPSPVYSTFLSRHLNRSISQNSSRTHLSTASIQPPSLPPLDLRPQFPPQTLPGTTPSRTSRGLVPPSLPTAVAIPNEQSGVYDDASSVRAESFMTAHSTYTPAPPGDDTTAPVAAGNDLEMDIGLRVTAGAGRDERAHTATGDFGSHAEQGSIRSMMTRSLQESQSLSSSSSSSSSSFVDRRWLRGISYGRSPEVPSTRPWKFRPSSKAACVLFWVGFIAPWCWLIGGWLLTNEGEAKLFFGRLGAGHHKGASKSSGLLPLWSVEKLKKNHDMEKQGSLVMGLGYPFIAPSLNSLGSSIADSPADQKLPRMIWKSRKELDRWVVRCRIAAVTSGVLITAAFIVALIVVSKDR